MEALEPMRDAVETALLALLHWRGQDSKAQPTLGLIDSTLVQTSLLPSEYLSHIARLRDLQSELDEDQAHKLLAHSDKLFSQAVSLLKSAQPS